MLRDWENTYRNKGAVQKGLLPTVVSAVETLRQYGCSSVLDLCCGAGRHSIFLARSGFEVYGIDLSDTAINIAQTLAQSEGLSCVKFTVGDMRAIQFPDCYMDAVVCVWSTGHGFQDEFIKSIDEMFRVLKPGGLLLADFPSSADRNCGQGFEISHQTYLHPFLDHPDVPHYYCTRSELEGYLAPHVKQVKIEEIDYEDSKYNSVIKAFWVEALKKF